MKISFTKYPIDIILCIIWAIILPPLTLLSMDTTLRTILGLPFILFIPGYVLIFVLYPTKQGEKGISEIERLGLSLGFSIVITSFLGLILNFTPWGIQLESIILSLFLFTEGFGIIAFYRWKRINPDQRFIISLDTSHFKSSNTIQTMILVLVIFIAGASIIYLIVTPNTEDSFTEFYILNVNGNSTNYPRDIITGGNTSIILGLINHEYKIMNYTIEIWLINQSNIFNKSAQKNDSIYNHAWFMDKIVISLDHTKITNDETQIKKWEYNYTFTTNKTGNFEMVFLLFISPSEDHNAEKDYNGSIDLEIKNAYKELHLWLYVS